jgi:hypothetical protein
MSGIVPLKGYFCFSFENSFVDRRRSKIKSKKKVK